MVVSKKRVTTQGPKKRRPSPLDSLRLKKPPTIDFISSSNSHPTTPSLRSPCAIHDVLCTACIEVICSEMMYLDFSFFYRALGFGPTRCALITLRTRSNFGGTLPVCLAVKSVLQEATTHGEDGNPCPCYVRVLCCCFVIQFPSLSLESIQDSEETGQETLEHK